MQRKKPEEEKFLAELPLVTGEAKFLQFFQAMSFSKSLLVQDRESVSDEIHCSAVCLIGSHGIQVVSSTTNLIIN